MHYDHRHKKGSVIAFLAGVGVGIITTGIYFLGPGGHGRRERMSWWIKDVRGEILSRMREVENISRDKYRRIVDTVAQEYGQARHLTEAQVSELKERFKDRWLQMLSLVEQSAREARKEIEDES